jgi:ATP-dependent Lhr-like helicase
LRQLLVPPSRRRTPVAAMGRWSLLGRGSEGEVAIEFVACQLLARTGVVFRKVLQRERLNVAWRDLLRAYRTMELRGEIRGGRFVAGFSGEQFALPRAVRLLRKLRREDRSPVVVAAADPLNYSGILTPDERISPLVRERVTVG